MSSMKNKIGYFSLYSFCFCLFTACSQKIPAAEKTTTAETYAFDFTTSEQLMPLLAKAGEQNKLVFVDFYTDWCLPCRLMEEEVFTDKELATYINQNFINYRVDAEKDHGPNLAAIFEVKAYPTLLFLDTGGRVLVRKEGSVSSSMFKRLAEKALESQP